MNNLTGTTATTGDTTLEVRGVKIQRGVGVRESGVNHDLLEGMVDQTYRPWRHVPGVAEAMEMGLGPYDDPDAFDGVHQIDVRGHRAVEYVRDGTYFLIWAGSAAKEDEKGNNAYVSHLASVVEAFLLKELMVSTFSRLVRSQNVQGRLRAALVRAGTTVYCSGQAMDMSTEHGRMMWDVQALVYSMDRDQIERRMILGELYGASRGLWVPGEAMVPPGYELVHGPGGRRLQVSQDPAEVQRTRDMIAILAGEGSHRSKTAALADLGIERHVFRDGRRTSARIDSARYPAGTIRTLHGYRHLYRDGIYAYRRQVPKFAGIDEIAGFPIQEEDGEHFVEAPLHVGLPEGGWATEDLFIQWDALIHRNALASPTNYGGADHDQAKPLTGMCRYQDGADEYALLSDGRRAYQLRERPVDPHRVGDGWYEDRANSNIVAEFDAHRLHAAIATGVRDALTSGCNVELRDAEVAVRDDGTAHVLFIDDRTRQSALKDRIGRHEEQLTRLADLAADADSDMLARQYNTRANKVVAEIERTRELLEKASPAARPLPPDNVVVHGRTLLRALEALGAIKTLADRDVARAIRTVLKDLRFHLDGDTARWTVDVHLPTASGLAILRGITGELPRYCRAAKYKAAAGREDAARSLAEDLAAGRTTEQVLATDRRYGVALSKDQLGRTLKLAGVSQAAHRFVSGHPIPEVRAVLVGAALGRPPSSDLDPEWIGLVQGAVDAWSPNTYISRSTVTWAAERQPALDALHDAGGELSLPELAGALGMEQPGKLARQLGYRCAKPGTNWEALRPEGRSAQLIDVADGRLRLRHCPCGGSRWIVVSLPEMRGLICAECMHAHRIRFPDSYRHWTTLTPLAAAIRNLRSPLQARLARVPDGTFMMKDWGESVGTAGSSLNAVRQRLIDQGLLEELGRSQTQQGPGMAPMLYRLTPKGRRLKTQGATDGGSA